MMRGAVQDGLAPRFISQIVLYFEIKHYVGHKNHAHRKRETVCRKKTERSERDYLFVLGEPFPCELLELGARAAVVGIRMDGDATARSEDTSHLDVARIHELDKVLHDDVDAVLVEVAMAAEGEQIELERLRLHHLDIGDIGDDDVGKVRLASDGTQRGELRAIELHPVVVLLMRILESLKHFGCIVLLIEGALASQEGECLFVFSFHNMNN